jgi:hypothetical protein
VVTFFNFANVITFWNVHLSQNRSLFPQLCHLEDSFAVEPCLYSLLAGPVGLQ